MPSLSYRLPALPRILDAEAARYSLLRQTECPTCKSTGSFLWNYDESGEKLPDDAELVTWRCDCRCQRKLRDFLTVRNIKRPFQLTGWDDLTEPMNGAYATAVDYSMNCESYLQAGLGLIFHGSHGSGKTALATLIAKSVMAADIDVQYMVLQQLVDATVAAWGTSKSYDPGAVEWMRQRVHEIPLLVLDDVGREEKAGTELQQRALTDVLSLRVDAGRPTIISTTLSPEVLEQHYRPIGGRSLSSVMELTETKTQSMFDMAADRRKWEVSRGIVRPTRLV